MNPNDCKTCLNKHALCANGYCIGYAPNDAQAKDNVLSQAMDGLIDALGLDWAYLVRACPVCGSPLSDSGACEDVGDNNCQYLGEPASG